MTTAALFSHTLFPAPPPYPSVPSSLLPATPSFPTPLKKVQFTATTETHGRLDVSLDSEGNGEYANCFTVPRIHLPQVKPRVNDMAHKVPQKYHIGLTADTGPAPFGKQSIDGQAKDSFPDHHDFFELTTTAVKSNNLHISPTIKGSGGTEAAAEVPVPEGFVKPGEAGGGGAGGRKLTPGGQTSPAKIMHSDSQNHARHVKEMKELVGQAVFHQTQLAQEIDASASNESNESNTNGEGANNAASSTTVVSCTV